MPESAKNAALILFPFARNYRRLKLSAKWWHRLAVVLLCAVAILTFGLSVAVPLMDEIGARKSAVSDAYDELAKEAQTAKPDWFAQNAPSKQDGPIDLTAGLVKRPAPAFDPYAPYGGSVAHDPEKTSLPEGFNKTIMVAVQGQRISFPGNMTDAEIVAAICRELKPSPKSCWTVVKERPSAPPQPVELSEDEVSKPVDLVGLAKDSHPIHIFRIFGIAALITLVTSYVLQALYRAVIFVGFGDPKQAS